MRSLRIAALVLEEPVVSDNPLAGTTWILTELDGQPLIPRSQITAQFNENGVVSVINETQITANFAEDGQLAGNASCNGYFGPYETEDNNIAMGPFGTTRKLCPDPVMDQESQYLTALESAATYKFDGINLNMQTTDAATTVNMQPTSTVSGVESNAAAHRLSSLPGM